MFLGYPNDQKGYKLLNILVKNTLISRDVQFHENTFRFQQDSFDANGKAIPNPTLISNCWSDDYIEQLCSKLESFTPTDSPSASALNQSSL